MRPILTSSILAILLFSATACGDDAGDDDDDDDDDVVVDASAVDAASSDGPSGDALPVEDASNAQDGATTDAGGEITAICTEVCNELVECADDDAGTLELGECIAGCSDDLADCSDPQLEAIAGCSQSPSCEALLNCIGAQSCVDM
jgi:hypothetical protein